MKTYNKKYKFKAKIHNKKKGFTLIELIGVIAIMSILAVVFTKNISGYIDEAKKTKVIEQSRRVVMAVDTHQMKKGGDFSESTVGDIKGNSSINTYIDDELANLTNTMTVEECRNIVENSAEFDIDEDGIFNGMATSGQN